jgi:hypothetical protein
MFSQNLSGPSTGLSFTDFLLRQYFEAFFKDFFQHWVFLKVGAEIPFEKVFGVSQRKTTLLPPERKPRPLDSDKMPLILAVSNCRCGFKITN